jgi:MFS family permease
MKNRGTIKVVGAGTPHSLENSLGLVGTDFNWAVSITYFAVTLFLLPANLTMKKISAKNFFPIVMVSFGAISMCLAAAKNAAGFLTGRFFLGIPEAGVVPAVVMYFSMW